MVSAVAAKRFTVELERVEAKRPEMRARRVAATVQRLRAGGSG
jgi:hypothetical protein